MIKISVIIPVYNAEKYLAECLDSVLKQTLKDIEIICINDGSTDNSLAVLKEYARHDSRINITDKANEGAAAAKNAGLKAARGEFVAFMDSDDFYPRTDVLETLYNTAVKNGADVCGGSLNFCIDGNITAEAEDGYIFKADGFVPFSGYQFDYGFTRFIYRRSFLSKNNLSFPSLVYHEDPPFLVKALSSAKKFYALSKPVYIYRGAHKEPSWNINKLTGFLKGIGLLADLSIENKFDRLFARILNRVNDPYFLNAFRSVQMDDSLKALLRATAGTFKKYKNARLSDYYAFLLQECKVSVIVPVYNVEKYLGKCLDSIVNQTYKNLEIICVNDGATDGSPALLEKYAAADSRIKIINKKNGGLSSARNAGLAAASADYCFFADSDDWIEKDTIFSMLEKMTYHNVDAVVCHAVNIAEDVFSRQICKDAQAWFDSYLKAEGIYAPAMDLKKDLVSVAWNKLYKTSIIKKYNLTFPEGLVNEDEVFLWAYMLQAGTYYFIPNPFYNYLRRGDSIMSVRNASVKILDVLKIQEIIYQTVRKYRNVKQYKDILFQNYIIDADMVFNEMQGPFKEQALELVKRYAFKINKKDFRLKEYYWDKKYPKLYRFVKRLFKSVFSVKKESKGLGKNYKRITLLGIKFKIKQRTKIKTLIREIEFLKNENNYLWSHIHSLNNKIDAVGKQYLDNQKLIVGLQEQTLLQKKQLEQKGEDCRRQQFYDFLDGLKPFPIQKIDKQGRCSAVLSSPWDNVRYIFDNVKISFINEPEANTPADYYFLWGTQFYEDNYKTTQLAKFYNKPLFIFEDGFLKSINTWVAKNENKKYLNGVSFTIDSVCPYFDATKASSLELMLNNAELVITEEQKQRARNCINKIVETHLTKYNHQPVFEPAIGRKGVKKVLVVDQSYGDMSIAKGLASENTFKVMLQDAIAENPDADIIVKTHPDTMAGAGGYYTGLKAHDNVYTMTEPVNPLSLIKCCDKVYVCTTQLGFEALMCNKEVHVYGMPFYAGWGLTKDKQKCARRTHTRTLEEVFYISYIIYTYYVNPDTKRRCEIEEAMDYLLKLREEYRNEYRKTNA